MSHYQLIQRALRLIKDADVVMVVPKSDGTFGEGTLYEMAVAEMLEKTVISIKDKEEKNE